MRLFILSVAFIAAASSAALAVGRGWHGPGWYVVMNTPVKEHDLFKGAYKSEQECMADKPEDRGAISYECIKVDTQPYDAN